jgi:hypothetical protein
MADLADARLKLELALAAEAEAKVRAQDAIDEAQLRAAEELDLLRRDRDEAREALEGLRRATPDAPAPARAEASDEGNDEASELRKELALAWAVQESRGREQEAERAELTRQLEAARSALAVTEQRLQELTVRLSDRDHKLERLQQRLYAQETELSGLRETRPSAVATARLRHAAEITSPGTRRPLPPAPTAGPPVLRPAAPPVLKPVDPGAPSERPPLPPSDPSKKP